MNNTTPSVSARSIVAGLCLMASMVSPASAQELLAGVAANGRLVVFSSADPCEVEVIQVSGLAAGESILGIDRRPATGQLYALGSTSRLYTIDLASGEAQAVGAGPFAPALSGSAFGFDFNPTVDRIRIVSNTGQNLRAHPDTGAILFTDGSLAYAMGDPAFGDSPAVAGAAYTNSDNDPATGTTLFDIDAAAATLVRQDPPNSGVLNTVGSLGIDIEAVGGFDIAVSDGTAWASIVPATVTAARAKGNRDRARLYTIDLATGEATKVGKIGGPKFLHSLTALGAVD